MRLVIIILMISFTSCSSSENEPDPICAIDIRNLSLNDPQKIVGTWKRLAGRTLGCREATLIDPPLILEITVDSVFIKEGEYDASGNRAFKLTQQTSVFGTSFLQFDFNVVLLTPGDSLIVDTQFRDGTQVFFIRD